MLSGLVGNPVAALMMGAALAFGASGAGIARDETRDLLVDAALASPVEAEAGPVWDGEADLVPPPPAAADLDQWSPDVSAWTEPALLDLALALLDAPTHGLPAQEALADRLLDRTRPVAARAVEAGPAFLRYAAWLEYGVLDADTLAPRRLTDTDIAPLAARLRAALSGQGDIADALAQSAPSVGDYELLRREMVRLMTVRPIWPAIAPGDALAVGDTGPRVDQLRARLAAEGLLAPDWEEGTPYDVRLETAVRRFQGRVNLAPDGTLGPATLRQLNITPEDRLRQLRANLEQRRWRTRDPGERHIWVNLADFRLEAWEGGELARVHQVMVGRQVSSTPEFSDTMEYIVLNPWWHLPGGLARGRFSSFRRNPGLAAARGFRIYDSGGRPVSVYDLDWSRWNNGWPYRLSQPPGGDNPMGEVKFMFPNRHNIYIHDTTERDEFIRTQRDFSAGCIRVQDPMALVEWVLSRQPDWPRERIDAVSAGTTPTTVRLDDHIPVHIAYWTVVGDADGRVRFLNDLYQRDGALIAAYDAALSRAEGRMIAARAEPVSATSVAWE